jgi:branched-chain amino acid aminotransferase
MKKYRVYINDKLIPAEKASISVFDGAYLYGEGLFETLIAVDGKVPLLKEHLQRLYRGIRALGIPMSLSKEALSKAIYKTLKVNGLVDAYIRVNVSAEEAALGKRRRLPADTHVVIITKPPDPYPEVLYSRGARLVVVQNLINDPVGIATIKTTNYLVKMLGRRQVMARKADEGILLNAKGHATECTSSNLFLIKKGVLRTPRLAEGLIPGITRRSVMSLARRRRIPVQEAVVTIKQLETADEIFITSTLKGIMPVSYLERRRIAKDIPGPITQRLMDAYRLSIKSSKKDLAR